MTSSLVYTDERNSCVFFPELAWMASQFFLRANPQYSNLKHLTEIGKYIYNTYTHTYIEIGKYNVYYIYLYIVME